MHPYEHNEHWNETISTRDEWSNWNADIWQVDLINMTRIACVFRGLRYCLHLGYMVRLGFFCYVRVFEKRGEHQFNFVIFYSVIALISLCFWFPLFVSSNNRIFYSLLLLLSAISGAALNVLTSLNRAFNFFSLNLLSSTFILATMWCICSLVNLTRRKKELPTQTSKICTL